MFYNHALSRALSRIRSPWYAASANKELSVSSELITGSHAWYRDAVPYPDEAEAPALELIFSRPVSGSLPWRDIEALFQELGGNVSERAGSRVAVVLFGEVRVFHRPHPSPHTGKGAVASIRKWLEEHGVTP